VGESVNLAKIVIQAPMEEWYRPSHKTPLNGVMAGHPVTKGVVGAGLTPLRHYVTLLAVFEPPHSPLADGLNRFLSIQLVHARGESSHWWQLVGLVL
jgi:hypothetical protein